MKVPITKGGAIFHNFVYDRKGFQFSGDTQIVFNGFAIGMLTVLLGSPVCYWRMKKTKAVNRNHKE